MAYTATQVSCVVPENMLTFNKTTTLIKYNRRCKNGNIDPSFPSFCLDVDECMGETDNCAVTATCTNNPGNFTCQCNAGFIGDGIDCTGK